MTLSGIATCACLSVLFYCCHALSISYLSPAHVLVKYLPNATGAWEVWSMLAVSHLSSAAVLVQLMLVYC